ncbi:hypothetical protein [Fundidesulfovibrio terrae]|uniref:hypothetical protein n=1 Tax=Fundidesulfovibrio terrae TaxID=2922866 RepID=UPI001FAF8E38|nr:hypothetical protein [Fundidesulfovibrio terrae]
MSLPRPQKIIRERFDVLEEDKSLTFRHEDCAPIGGASGNLFFLGMEGSGIESLARDAAARLGLAPAEAASAGEIEALLARSGQAVAVTNSALVEDAALVSAMRASGKVFYLMSMPHVLAARLDDPSRTGALAAELSRLEPLFMNAAHFILSVDATPEEMLDDVAEKARL